MATLIVKGDKLIIEVDISAAALAAAPLSSSGKTRLIDSYSLPVPGKPGIRAAGNVMVKP